MLQASLAGGDVECGEGPARGEENRLVQPGYEASLLLVDGDPTRDISATERISSVVFKGERVRRVELFDASKNPLE